MGVERRCRNIVNVITNVNGENFFLYLGMRHGCICTRLLRLGDVESESASLVAIFYSSEWPGARIILTSSAGTLRPQAHRRPNTISGA